VARKPGLYAIYARSEEVFPEPLAGYLRDRGSTLIYIGKATGSLKDRLVEQDLGHKKPSTFFRAIGSILGFRPPRGSLKKKQKQINYKFSPGDTQKITGWISDNLSVR